MRQIQPDVVITQHPQRNWERLQSSHPDHLAVGEATVRAVYPAVENPFAYPALKHLPAFRIHQVWMMAAPAELVNLRRSEERRVGRESTSLRTKKSQESRGTRQER